MDGTGADGLRKGYVAAVLHQGYRNVLVGSSIFTTNPKVSRTNIMPIGISLANDPAHYLHFSTCMLPPCDETLSSTTWLELRSAAAALMWHRSFGRAAAGQPHSSKRLTVNVMLTKADPATRTLLYSFLIAGMWKGESHWKNSFSDFRATSLKLNAV